MAGNANFTSIVRFGDDGFTIGAANDLNIFIDSTGTGDQGVIQNTVGQKIRFKVQSAGGVPTEVFEVQGAGLIPTVTNTFDIGDQNYKWRNVYATSFNGLATNATNLQVGSNFRTGDVNATNNTVAVRDSSGNIAANTFNGTATSAQYADLAEKYTTDKDYPVGTLMTIGGEKEATACEGADMTCIGVISTRPAYLMNSDCEGQAIALVGRVPVRITGPVSKGNKVYVAKNGTASTDGDGDMIGIALEDNDRHEETLVECILKL